MADPATRLRQAASDLADRGPPPGRAWCGAWTGELDAALTELLDGATPGPGAVAVVAVGGYGRGEVCPGSDVDVLLLTDRAPLEQQTSLVRDVVYPLWDAGLKVGHAVRDRRGAVAACADVRTATATLDARPVAGAVGLVPPLRAAVIAELRRRPDRFLAGLATEDRERHRRRGDAAETLEPDVKAGAGGLRDIQSLRWAAAALLGETDLDALVAGRYLAAADRSRLARAEELLLAVRVALHLEAGRGDDRLTFDRQEPVAHRLGRGDDGDRPAGEVLLHDVFLAARATDHAHTTAWRLLAADAARVRRRGPAARRRRRPPDVEVPGGFSVADGVLTIAGADTTASDFPVRLLEALVGSGAALERGGATAVRRAIATGAASGWTWDDGGGDRLLAVLWRGAPSLPAITELDDLGVLAATIPEWAPLRARPQRNPYHRYSLDRHLLHAATGLADLTRREGWAAAALDRVGDRDGLMLAALVHDVGKAHGEPHSETGIPVAAAIARRLGADEARVALVERLVRHHLLLPDVATRRDVTDPGLVRAVAATVGDRDTLACLRLLAAADGLATGPSAWSSWKAQLVATLAEEVRAVLDDTAAADDASAAARAADEARRIAPGLGVDRATVTAHLDLLPDRYAAAVGARAIVRHAGLAVSPVDPGEVRTRVTPAETDLERVDLLDVVARDSPGLFATVAGVIALHGGSVLSAYAFTRSDGVAVDTFTVRRPEHADPADGGRLSSWWAAVEGDLVEAMAGRLAVRARVERRADAHAAVRPSGPEVATHVQIDADASGATTIVEVHTADSAGVLYRIAAALAELQLDVVAAKVDTVGGEAIDVFYVRDARGRALDDDHAGEVVLAVSDALAD